MSSGWNNTAAAMVLTSDSASNCPMLAVPGWFESIRLPKATAVVMPLKNTARVSGEAYSPLRPSRHAMM